jgi:hypothetical protein
VSTQVAEMGPFSPIYIVSMYDNGRAVGVLDNLSFQSSSLSVTNTGGEDFTDVNITDGRRSGSRIDRGIQ